MRNCHVGALRNASENNSSGTEAYFTTQRSPFGKFRSLPNVPISAQSMRPFRIYGLASKEVGVEERVAEFSLWVELFGQLKKFRKLFVGGLQLSRRNCKQFSPVWARVKRSEFPFDDGQKGADGGPILFPGEMSGHRRLFITWAQPKVVRSDGANF